MKALLIFLLVLGKAGALCAEAPAYLREAKRIVFLGDSITYAGSYVTWIEAWLTMKHPDPERVVINLGLASETVSGLSEEGHAGGRFPRPDLQERLRRVLAAAKPDLVFACYGMNCGIYKPAQEERARAFRKGIEQLRQAVAEQGGTVIHLTPWAYDHGRGRIPTQDYNEAVLGTYAEWLLSKRKEGWEVIDLHGPMTAEIVKRRQADPKFTFQPDGVHPNREGHWFGAQQVIKFLGDEKAAGAPDAHVMMRMFPGGPKILPLIEARMKLLRDAWLSQTGHTRPGVKGGLPLAAAKAKAAELSDEIRSIRKESARP